MGWFMIDVEKDSMKDAMKEAVREVQKKRRDLTMKELVDHPEVLQLAVLSNLTTIRHVLIWIALALTVIAGILWQKL